MTRWVEGAFIDLLLSLARSQSAGTGGGSILPRPAVACKYTLSLCSKGVNPQLACRCAAPDTPASGVCQCARPKVVLGPVSRRCYFSGKDLIDPGISGHRGHQETHFGERTQHVHNGCNVGPIGRHDEG